jgi:hypothetical protein
MRKTCLKMLQEKFEQKKKKKGRLRNTIIPMCQAEK